DRAAGHREGHRRVRDALLHAIDEELDRGVPGALGDLPALELGGQEADVDRAVRAPVRRRVRVEEELGAGEQLPPAQLRQGAAVAGLGATEVVGASQSREHPSLRALEWPRIRGMTPFHPTCT